MAARIAAAACVLMIAFVTADESTHSYADSEKVVVYANKIGPFNNPLETYAYFELPGCPPASWDHKFPSLGQALAGDELYEMNIPIKFRQNVPKGTICDFAPTTTDALKWDLMVKEQYWYQLHVDELPMWATFGKVIDGVPNIFTHQRFSFGVNGDRLVIANLTADEPRPIKGGEKYAFTYSIAFSESTVRFEHRFNRYLDETFFEHRIHWFSIFNSFMMVLFLAGLVLTIFTRTLKADIAKYAEERDAREHGRDDWNEDSGWKQLHADVFRVPARPTILCALVGTGVQLIVLCLIVIVIAIVSVVYTSPGSLATYFVVAYAATSYVAGYVSAGRFAHYCLIGPGISSQWMQCMILTAALFPGVVMLLGFLLNFVAIAYDSAQAIPFGGMVVMVLLWGLVALPLVVMGTVVGRHRGPVGSGHPTRPPEVPRVNLIPRMIPLRPWFLSRAVFILGGGILPFGSIFIELYFIFTSFWNYKLYYVYGFMLLVFAILLLVTGCVSIVSTYFQLNSEDHRWPWTSFALGGSTSLYVFLYSAYFYAFKTKMTGFFMFSFYFTYTLMMCIGIAIVCGTVSHLAASTFVQRIYRTVKAD